MVDECLDEVNERTSYTLTVSFFDEDSVAVIPDAATVRIDDQQRRTSIRPLEAIGSLATTVDIEVTSEENRIIRTRSEFEIRTVTVEWDYTSPGGPKHGTTQYRYRLLNLYGVVDIPSPSVSPSASASPSV